MKKHNINLDLYNEKIKKLFLEKNVNKILSSDIREYLGGIKNFRHWGHLLSLFIEKGFIVRTNTFEKINGRPIFYYSLIEHEFKDYNISDLFLLVDQKNKNHFCIKKNLNKKLKDLFEVNSIGEIQVYKIFKSFKCDMYFTSINNEKDK